MHCISLLATWTSNGPLVSAVLPLLVVAKGLKQGSVVHFRGRGGIVATMSSSETKSIVNGSCVHIVCGVGFRLVSF